MVLHTLARGAGATVGAAVLISLVSFAAAAQTKAQDKNKRPSLKLSATPAMSFSPARVVFVGELRGGADDYADLYCAAAEWEWGDETRFEHKYDCEPYEPGKSEIKRRFTAEHRYMSAGSYRVSLRLKQNDKVISSATTTVRVRPGLRDPGDDGLVP
jgi:hypothetical protein